eukprot:gene8256-10146_t
MYKHRIEILKRQLDQSLQTTGQTTIKFNNIQYQPISHIDVPQLKVILDSPEATKYKDVARKFLANEPSFKNVVGIDPVEYKQLVLEQLKSLAKNGIIRFTDIRENLLRLVSTIDVLATYNNNICTKIGVHYSLFGGTVLLLGTERHEKYVKEADSLDIVGCFSMTELGHGSNVRGLETTAVYDKATQEFIINSPTPTSQKFWIGGAGLHAHYTTVFARLIIDDTDHGIHAFVVPIRDRKTNLVLPGVTIRDCGPKLGLNGVDNGQLKFENVRIPRVNLLNKYSDVDERGVYSSKFANPVKHFAAIMEPFIGGRLAITKCCSAAKTCLAIAIRYSFFRKQFGPSLSNEQPLITLSSQQRRLMIPLARTIMLDFYVHLMTRILQSKKRPVSVHAHCSGAKAIYSWHCINTMQVCREACGGQGYRSENRIAEFKSDCDIICTYEGDNTVLMQQVAKYLIQLETPNYTPVYLAGDAQSVLFNFNNLLALFKAREAMKIAEVKQLLNTTGGDPYTAFNKAIPWAIAAGHAHMDYNILENAIEVINKNNIAPLPHLCLLDTLSKIEDDLGWFIGHKLISPEVANSVSYLVMDLCAHICPFSRSIIDAFDIPKKCLPSEDLLDSLL